MQGDEINTAEEQGTETNAIVNTDGGFSVWFVRISGIVLFALLVILAIVTGMMDATRFTELISNVYLTIPLVAGSYFLRFALQYLSLLLFSGIGRKQIRVGFSEKNISPFVHARRPFELGKYRIYLILPVFVMSLLPFVSLFFFPYKELYFIAAYTLSFCINDGLSFVRSLRYPSYMLAADHPSRFGFVLYDNPFHL